MAIPGSAGANLAVASPRAPPLQAKGNPMPNACDIAGHAFPDPQIRQTARILLIGKAPAAHSHAVAAPVLARPAYLGYATFPGLAGAPPPTLDKLGFSDLVIATVSHILTRFRQPFVHQKTFHAHVQARLYPSCGAGPRRELISQAPQPDYPRLMVKR
jgi:hypothetical protein